MCIWWTATIVSSVVGGHSEGLLWWDWSLVSSKLLLYIFLISQYTICILIFWNLLLKDPMKSPFSVFTAIPADYIPFLVNFTGVFHVLFSRKWLSWNWVEIQLFFIQTKHKLQKQSWERIHIRKVLKFSLVRTKIQYKFCNSPIIWQQTACGGGVKRKSILDWGAFAFTSQANRTRVSLEANRDPLSGSRTVCLVRSRVWWLTSAQKGPHQGRKLVYCAINAVGVKAPSKTAFGSPTSLVLPHQSEVTVQSGLQRVKKTQPLEKTQMTIKYFILRI